ncbi:MAG: ATP-binding protein [Planctomycetota bacterium]
MTENERGGSERSRSFPLVYFQTAILLLGVGLIVLASESTIAPEFQRAVPLLCTLMVIWCGAQLGSFAFSLRARTSDLFTRTRLAIDLTFSLAIVWLTGGVVSFFLPLLFASVIATCTQLNLRRSLFLAGAVTAALTVMTLSQILGWRPAEWTGAVQLGVEGRWLFSVASLIGHGIALHLVAYLAAQLRTGREQAEWLGDQIVASIGNGIVALDDNGRVVQMNAAALELLGYPSDTEWRGRFPAEIFRREEDLALLAVLENPVPGLARAEWQCRGGEIIPMSISTTVTHDRSGGHTLTILLFQDLSLEVRAARAEERLRHLEALEDLALGLVHEIRNPLASIRGCVQELGKGTLPPEQSERFTRIVIRESDRLDRIVDEFLECSSASPTRVERVELVDLMDEVLESLQGREDAARISWTRCAPTSAVVWGHREMLYRVLLNLGVNAVEASSTESKIAFTVREDAAGWSVEVSDCGIGMDPTTRDRIFTPFFSTKNREGGLGLALVERIVSGHGGSIDVESTLGEGTTFRVFLPVGQPSLGSDSTLAPETEAANAV